MERRQVIATTVEQSRRLISAGLARETADMYWCLMTTGDPYLCSIDGHANDSGFKSLQTMGKVLPAWSAGALWQIVFARGSALVFEVSGITMPEVIDILVQNIVENYPPSWNARL